MPKPRAYVETTVPNFYYDFRTSPTVTERRNATRIWWAGAAERYELVTSTLVIAELSRGTSDNALRRVALASTIPVLPASDDADEVALVYNRHKLMPVKSPGDALHLALASLHECDLIVTWNCRHLANPNKARHIRQINTRLGLGIPKLVTPLELLREEP